MYKLTTRYVEWRISITTASLFVFPNVGFGLTAMARVFNTLMMRLGHDQFYVQGGDWGAIISTMMAWLYPEYVV